MIYGKVQPEKDEASLINEALMCHVKPVFELEYDGDGARLVGYHGNQETVWIPEEVTAIDDYVFAGHKEISKIVFPNALQEIGVKAFSGCTGIVTLLFPSAVRLICDYAFENCISLRYACVDDAGKPEWIEFGQRPFDGCIALEEVRLPEPEWWEDNPFQNCPLLHTIDIIGKSSIEDNLISIMIKDRGVGFQGMPEEHGGMGFQRMNSCMTELEVVSAPGKGTMVHMKRELKRYMGDEL